MELTTKPTISDYNRLKSALEKIANLKNADFRTWHKRGDRMQQIAKEALKISG